MGHIEYLIGEVKGRLRMPLLSFKVGDAYRMSLTHSLADEIWNYKHPDENVDSEDREYISWVNSLPRFLECAHRANLDDLIAVFEMKTPISNKAIDVLLVGKSAEGENRILIVELKQWSSISTRYVNNTNKVYVPEVRVTRRHPIRQLNLYEDSCKNDLKAMKNDREMGHDRQMGKIVCLHKNVKQEIL